MSRKRFRDVAPSHWAASYIYYLAERKIISGFPDPGEPVRAWDSCRFEPEGNVTLGEICTMAITAAGIEPPQEAPYNGTWGNENSGHWAIKYGMYVKSKGISIQLGNRDIEHIIGTPIQRQFAFNIVWHIISPHSERLRGTNYEIPINIRDSGKHLKFKDRGDVFLPCVAGIYGLIFNDVVGGFEEAVMDEHGNPILNSSEEVKTEWKLKPHDFVTRSQISCVIAACIATPDDIMAVEIPTVEGFVWPVPGWNKRGDVGRWGERWSREKDGTLKEGFHYGIDISTDAEISTVYPAENNFYVGRDVEAVADGVCFDVVDTITKGKDRNDRDGNRVFIEHTKNGFNWISVYIHLSEVAVKNGQSVKAGELIGKTGNTGNVVSSRGHGTHLHFEMYSSHNTSLRNSRSVNPLSTYHAHDMRGGDRKHEENAEYQRDWSNKWHHGYNPNPMFILGDNDLLIPNPRFYWDYDKIPSEFKKAVVHFSDRTEEVDGESITITRWEQLREYFETNFPEPIEE